MKRVRRNTLAAVVMTVGGFAALATPDLLGGVAGAPIRASAQENPRPPTHNPPARPSAPRLSSGQRIVRAPNGVCNLHREHRCPRGRGIRCNPPPPTPVECPALLPSPGRIVGMPDGTCRATLGSAREEVVPCPAVIPVTIHGLQ